MGNSWNVAMSALTAGNNIFCVLTANNYLFLRWKLWVGNRVKLLLPITPVHYSLPINAVFWRPRVQKVLVQWIQRFQFGINYKICACFLFSSFNNWAPLSLLDLLHFQLSLWLNWGNNFILKLINLILSEGSTMLKVKTLCLSLASASQALFYIFVLEQ